MDFVRLSFLDNDDVFILENQIQVYTWIFLNDDNVHKSIQINPKHGNLVDK